MSDIITLSQFMLEATALQKLVKLIGRRTHSSQAPLTWRDFDQRYRVWYELCISLLPPAFRQPFIQAYTEGVQHYPPFRDVIATMIATTTTGETSEPPVEAKPLLHSTDCYFALREVLPYQREQIFYARRQIWTERSVLPKGMALAVARICKDIFQLPSIENLFIRSGCDPHWFVPAFQPDPSSDRINEALGWLDGITVYAPERELEITRRVCERILERSNLSEKVRTEIEGWLAQLQQPAPQPNPLDRYPVHPTVRRIAGPLMAGGHHSQAIFQVCVTLNEEVQRVTGRSDLDGSKLMQQAFSSNSPMLRLAQDASEQQGWMHLYTGLIMAIRNPRGHRQVDDSDEATTLEWLLFASALFRALDGAVPVTSTTP